MTSYLTIQGFLVAAVALVFTGKFEKGHHIQSQAIILLSFLGILISMVVFISVRRARKAKENVRTHWRNNLSLKADKYEKIYFSQIL